MEKSKKTRLFKIISLAAVILIFAASAFASSKLLNKKADENNPNDNFSAKDVKVASLSELENQNFLSVQGTVKAVSKVDLIALGNGTAKAVDFEVGNKVVSGQTLAFLNDNIVTTNYSNALTNMNNLEQSYGSTNKFVLENIKQAELGVTRAKESLDGARLALDSAKDNYNNAINIQSKTKSDLKENAVIQYNNYLATVKNFLDQASYILIENDDQLPGIAPTLSVRNQETLVTAKSNYNSTSENYKKIIGKKVDADNAAYYLKAVSDLLSQTKNLADNMVEVLNNTPTSNTLSGATLSAQRSSFIGLKSNIIATQSSAQTMLQSLQNSDLVNKRELDGLQNAIKAAENQLNLAQVGYDNALSAQNNSKNSKDQQLAGSQISLDSSRGQLNLLAQQIENLTIKAPIDGQITAKTIEAGAEVRAGQKIGEISQTGLTKINLQVSADDSAKVRLGQQVKINKLYKGTINNINPSADPISKKIQVEVLFDNKNNELIPETFVTIDIPLKTMDLKMASYFIPLKAITISQNENFIFTVKDQKAVKAPIELLKIEGETAEIKMDISNDAMIIIEGNKLINDGDAVAVVR